jgi:AcrR family transcriptional regulator
MTSTRQSSLNLRKTPKQVRSRDTVDVILEATARILEEGGIAALNTNAVAGRAGIGIASLYDYFPNKDSILLEFARREIATHRFAVTKAVESALSSGEPELERAIIRALMNASDARMTIRRLAAQLLAAAGLEGELTESLRQISRLVAEKWPVARGADRRDLPAARLFVLTRAINGVLTAVVREGVHLDRQELEDELVAMAEGLSRKPARAA